MGTIDFRVCDFCERNVQLDGLNIKHFGKKLTDEQITSVLNDACREHRLELEKLQLQSTITSLELSLGKMREAFNKIININTSEAGKLMTEQRPFRLLSEIITVCDEALADKTPLKSIEVLKEVKEALKKLSEMATAGPVINGIAKSALVLIEGVI